MRVPIRLIATDLDGTLVGPAMQVPLRTRRALQQAMAQGCRVTIATGRAFLPTARVARQLGLNAPLLLCQGALIQDLQDGRVVHCQAIPLKLARQVIRYAQSRRLNVQVHLEDEQAYADNHNPSVARMSAISGVPIVLVADLSTWLPRPPLKFLFYEPHERIADLLRNLQAEFGEHLQVVQSHHNLVEVTDLHVSKGSALAWLADHLGIDQSETMAIGDHDNDASMMHWAGLGVAMGQASPAAQAAADVIAPILPEPPGPTQTDPVSGHTFPPHDEGVAWAIERYVLQPD